MRYGVLVGTEKKRDGSEGPGCESINQADLNPSFRCISIFQNENRTLC